MKNILISLTFAGLFMTSCNGFTENYTKTYSREIGQMMSPEYDTMRLSGKGVKIGVLDAGFGEFKTNRWTKGLNVVDYNNFVENDTLGFFDDEMTHGTSVCVNIGGRSGKDTIRGLAYDSDYYLAKIDLLDKEPRSEEDRMMKGVEWLLGKGVDIITSSISYTTFDDFDGYTSSMLDGKTSRISRFIDSVLQANPKLVFVQSAGNEGDKDWKYISFPSDVRDVITVGAVDWDKTQKMKYSGFGWDNADYIKPDVVVSDSPRGTSFSTPVIAGLCAAMLEYQKVDRSDLIKILHSSGTNAASPDKMIGYGVPQTSVILRILERNRDKSGVN